MANNIYIGMRYVPIYVGDYNSETVYEPLSIVAYNGASYTSKQAVPAGILPTNTTYWAKSGDFNAQYNELDGRITTAQDTADNAVTTAASAVTAANAAQDAADAAQSTANGAQSDVDTLETITDYMQKKFLLVGDSYANRDNSWEERFKTALGLTEGTDCFSIRVSGSGFTVSDGSLTWYTLVNNLANNMSQEQRDGITDVIMCGGANDRTATESDISAAILNVYNLVREKFANAKMYIGMIGWSSLSDQMSNFLRTLRAYKHVCENSRIFYLEGCEYALHNLSYLEDEYHPNVDGREALARAIVSAWKNGVADCIGINNVITYPDSVYDSTVFDIGSGNTNRLWGGMDGNSSWIKFERISATAVGADAVPGTWYTIADLSGYGYVIGDSTGRTFSCSGFLRAVSGGPYIMAPYEIRVKDHLLQIRFTNVESKVASIHQFFAGGLQLFFNSMNQRY